MNDFKLELEALNIVQHLDINKEGNPDETYTKLLKIITYAREKHMPTKFIKFSKYKHKKISWITTGILKSITFRSSMHRDLKLLSADELRYNILKQYLRFYNYILRNNTKQTSTVTLS